MMNQVSQALMGMLQKSYGCGRSSGGQGNSGGFGGFRNGNSGDPSANQGGQGFQPGQGNGGNNNYLSGGTQVSPSSQGD
jgi:hypothetical protein